MPFSQTSGKNQKLSYLKQNYSDNNGEESLIK